MANPTDSALPVPADMPPLACGQVWTYALVTVMLGQIGPNGMRERMLCGDDFSFCIVASDDDYKETLRLRQARLVLGPGSPWSPA